MRMLRCLLPLRAREQCAHECTCRGQDGADEQVVAVVVVVVVVVVVGIFRASVRG